MNLASMRILLKAAVFAGSFLCVIFQSVYAQGVLGTDEWTASAIANQTFDSREEALAATRALGGHYALADNLESVPTTTTVASYTYGARNRDLILNPWSRYCLQGGQNCWYGSEQEAIAASILGYGYNDPTCPQEFITPVTGWATQFEFEPGIATAEVRGYELHVYYRPPGAPSCESDIRQVQGVRDRVVECPQYTTWSTQEKKCILRGIATITGRPIQCAAQVGNPCDALTGDKFQRETDLDLPWITLSRNYHSIARSADEIFGVGWGSNLTSRLNVFGSNADKLSLVDENGFQIPFRSTNPFAFNVQESASGDGLRAHLVGGEWIIRRRDGSIDAFDRWSGSWIRTERADGTSLTAGYDGSARLASVTHSSGRAIALVYGQSGDLVDRIEVDGVAAIFYEYDSQFRLVNVTRQDGYSRHYHYEDIDSPELLTGISDESGSRYAIFAYDTQSRVVLSKHAGDVDAVTLDYKADGTTDVLFATGESRTYAPTGGAAFRKPSSIESSDGTYEFAYDESDYRRRTLVVIDKKGNESRIEYSEIGPVRTTKRTDAFGTASQRVVESDMDLDSGLAIGTRQAGRSRAYGYNARRQLTTVSVQDSVAALVRTSSTIFCEQSDITAGICPLLGLVKSVDGPRTDASDTAAYTYRMADEATCAASPATCPYRKGDLWKVTDALGHVTETVAYDGAGRVLSVKNPDGVDTDFEYHPRGWLAARKVRGANNASETDDRVTRMEYWPTGLVKKVIQPDGAYTAYAYDAAHRLTDVSDNAGNMIHYTLDNAGNRTGEDTKDPSGNLKRTLSRIYNQLGQLATQADAQSNPTGFVYDANGNADTLTDALSRVTDNDYDPLNRLKRTLQDVGGIAVETKFEYDAQDNLTRVVDPKGLDTTYAYNGFGDLTQLGSPDTGTTAYTYDSAGNRKTQTDARGVTTTYSYDALNRLTIIAYPDTSLDTGYAYDTAPAACQIGETFAKGRLSSMTDASGGTQYCYDRFGDLVRKVQTVNGVAFTVRYAYTKAGQLSGVTYPDGMAVDYVRNALGQATEVGVTAPGGTRQVLLTDAAYAPFGPATGWTYGNGRQLSRPLDQDYRPVAIQDAAAGGLDLGFGFDAVGNLDELTPAGGSALLVKFGYDALNRLTHYRDGPTNVAIETYAYDKTGNRTSFQNSAGTQAYTYPSTSHRLSEVDGVARSYDAAGSTTAIGNGRQFVYNDAGRMSQVKASGVVAAAYDYNGKGERVRKVAGGGKVYTLYDEAGRWLGDYDDPDGPLQQVVWLDDLPVGVVPGASPQLHYIQPDHLGTPRVVIEPVRNVAVWKWDLKNEAFGNSVPNQDPDGDSTAFVFDMRYPGQRYDSSTGLNYNYFRDYEAGTGRYAQSDLIGLEGGVSTYGYALGNPLTAYDPTGLQTPVMCLNPANAAACAAAGIATGSGATSSSGAATAAGGAAIGTSLAGLRSDSKSKQECEDNECARLNSVVQRAKALAAALGRCKWGMSRYELVLRYDAWLALAISRAQRDTKCWSGGDEGHQSAQANAWNNVGRCGSFIAGNYILGGALK